MPGPFPLKIKVSRAALEELSNSERGSYEDQEALPPEERERPLESHAHVVALRFRSCLEIRDAAEADDVYYAVCSGTFQLLAEWPERGGFYRTACRIADALRPHATPETVRRWPAPSGY